MYIFSAMTNTHTHMRVLTQPHTSVHKHKGRHISMDRNDLFTEVQKEVTQGRIDNVHELIMVSFSFRASHLKR